MRPGRAGLLALCVVLAPAVPLRAAPAAAGIARDAEFQRRVDGAIEKGVSWLRATQGDNGAFPSRESGNGFAAAYEFGCTALAVHALRSCGAPAADRQVQSGLRRMRQIWKTGRSSGGGGRTTYEVSLALLALEAHYAAPGEVPGKAAGRREIPSEDRDWIRDLALWLVRAQTAGGGFGYTSPPGRDGWADLSNAQYALLGLKAARRCGVEVRREVFRRSLEHFLSRQEVDGPEVERREGAGVDGAGDRHRKGGTRAVARDRARGWGYKGPTGTSGSMTAAGVSSVVICRGELLGTEGYSERHDAVAVKGIRDGIAWIGRYFSVTGNPFGKGGGSAGWHYYWLYGLERAGVLAGVAWMGARDWYGEGAEYLVRAQRAGGSWDSGGGRFGRRAGAAGSDGDFLDTCFALLFLKRATFRVEGAVATEERDDLLDLSAAAGLGEGEFGAIFDAVFARFLRAGPDRRGTLVADFVLLGERALPLLIRRLDDTDEEARGVAFAALERLTGITHGFLPGDPDEVRGKAVAAWEEWWFKNRGRIVADAAAGRFRL